MPSTRIPGITVNAAGQRIIDKEHRGVRIYARLNPVSEERHSSGSSLRSNVSNSNYGERPTVARFADAAARYLEESHDLRSADATAWHVRLLTPYIGTLELNRIHDRTLERFIADRRADGVRPRRSTAVSKSSVRCLTVPLVHRDDDGRPWLEGMPPSITMLPESRRAPYPITWEQQDRFFPKLPARLA